ncbi:uncharacterized protein SCHCODRAFT_02514674 [Schizophyllum commune H4-8]|uniref:Expressed protein n=1 Tax=Schizophyllum commune (strain H4-8 / FGSC 9210) TaxID=578458 RepID=D8QF69_SCHCM|nr:uncharacterized protein SCHCODRAFT_02514674 [Schizophyllum commune H4-8]KAI5887517.1 hypothetical protein SCHCODRAFT_02514674 [Schizophyllum commune H4-8]
MKSLSLLALASIAFGAVHAQDSNVNTETGTVELPTSVYSTLISMSSSGSGPYACTTATTTSSTPITLSPPASLTSSRWPSDGSTFISVTSTVPETTTTASGETTTATNGTTTSNAATIPTSRSSGGSSTRSSTSTSASPSTTDGGDNDAAVGLQASLGWGLLIMPVIFMLGN